MRSPLRLSATMTLALALSLSACTYSPNFADGVVMCGVDDSCPKGYTCAVDGTCRKHPETARPDAGANPDTGTSPDAGDVVSKFLGRWTFPSGTLDSTCDGSPVQRNAVPADDFIDVYMDVDRGFKDLLVKYYCDAGWTLTIGGTGTNAIANNAAQVCPRMTVFQNVTTTFNWSAVTLSLSTTDGVSGSISAHLKGPYTDSTNAHGTCDLTITGSLKKTAN
jgi:hypothetical protein